MADRKYDIMDDEFRVIGHSTQQDRAVKNKRRRRWWALTAAVIIVLSIIVTVFSKKPKELPENPDEGVFEYVPEIIIPQVITPLGTDSALTATEKLDTIINDVHLSIFIPQNAVPELTVGVPDRNDKSIILAAQAADIRQDNRKILGAFVLKGEPLAWGLSKKGYCAIIDGNITVGVSENSPLFEEATEKGGYFFRQYPLVDNGRLVESELKNKTMRKALCSRAGQIIMVVSETDESMHDFAQALVDLGVENAIYLVGSHSSFGWYIDKTGEKTLFAPDVHRGTYRNENYIVWRGSE